MNNDVFINCPFDDDYNELLLAITFTICYAGFVPRSALETKETGKERIAKLIDVIRQCRFGIHDISRTELPKTDPALPRFNMPFELGLFYGARHFGENEQKEKQLLVLDSERYRYQKVISDLAGNDPCAHSNLPAEAIAHVRDFLTGKNGGGTLPGAAHFQRMYGDFNSALPRIAKQLKISKEEIKNRRHWPDYTRCANAWVERKRELEESKTRRRVRLTGPTIRKG